MIRLFMLAARVAAPVVVSSLAVESAALAQQVNVPVAGFQDAIAISALLTTLNSGFFGQGQSFTNVPPNAAVNQDGRGVWVRGNAGQLDTKSLGTLNGGGVSGVIPAFTRTTYGGAQAGVDLGKFNLGGSGIGVVYGVTGGDVSANGYVTNSAASSAFEVPFVGTYVVVSKDGFVAEASYRHDFITSHVIDTYSKLDAPNLSGSSDTAAFSAAYKYKLPANFFVEGSGSFFVSRTTLDSFFVPGNTNLLVPQSPGVAHVNPANSDLGRLGLRIGESMTVAGIGLEPFFSFSFWNEFAGPSSASFTTTTGTSFNGVANRIGSFEQYSVGVSASITSSLLAFVRGDLRSGSNLTGNNISGGLRYTF